MHNLGMRNEELGISEGCVASNRTPSNYGRLAHVSCFQASQGCAKAVGSAQYAWAKVGGFIHQEFNARVAWVKNVFFYQTFARNAAVLIHTAFAYFQSVIDRLCTVCTGLTKTTTIKLYVYIEGAVMSKKSKVKSKKLLKLRHREVTV